MTDPSGFIITYRMHSCELITNLSTQKVLCHPQHRTPDLISYTGVTGRWGLLLIHEQSKPHLPGKSRPRCYAKSPIAQEVFLIPGFISGWFSMSPLPRLHHHDIMTIVELFFSFPGGSPCHHCLDYIIFTSFTTSALCQESKLLKKKKNSIPWL